ncbi:MAG: flotillin-like protein FloA [Maioricimonas sp. JB045]|uniref:flotillin-like protein FloA n=1 Tax=Maioricimonas sp. JC845 TaxID=3232138 RepID=UPI00345896A2
MTYAWGNVLAAVVVIGVLLVMSRYFGLWLRAYVTGTRIGIFSLMMMSLRKVSPRVIVDCQVMAVQAGLQRIPTRSLETQYLAGGNVQRVILALITAHRASIDLEWDTAAAIDLAGRDILEAVQVSVNPRVIDCPDPDSTRAGTLNGVAKDGIQLRVRVRVTVRTSIAQLVGGATESTVIARVGQGIVSSIGSCATYREALADPMIISRKVLAMGLDSQTAFSIVSIDIADIDVGENIGAKLRIEQADADIRIALSDAEKRRAMAIARNQEMIALTRQREAEVVLAEAQIPLAIAGALEGGNMRRTDDRIRFACDAAAGFPSMMPAPTTAG